jgi:hypothetical protein
VVIYEIRTYTLAPGTIVEAEKRFGEGYKVREQYSKLAGFFRSDIGPLNEMIHIWPYADFAERARIRAEAAKEAAWPPNTAEFVVNQKVEIVLPFPFVPEWTPGPDGPIYELRQYTFRGGTLPDIMKSWEAALPERVKYSKPALVGSVEFGPSANSFIHLWPYQSLNQRNDIRASAVASGKWPPSGGRDRYLTQTNKILLPSSFSPAR